MPTPTASDAALPFRSFAAGVDPARPGVTLRRLVDAGADRLPRPGHGTLSRWRALADVAAADLSLVKLFEGHTDALAILAELGEADVPAGSTWAVWAAEPPDARLRLQRTDDGRCTLHGDKAWCSGAATVSHALVTAWGDEDAPQLVAVDLAQTCIHHDIGAWRAVGMAATGSARLHFDGAAARCVGRPGDYLTRPGFWHGGAGIAACWYGAACALAEALHARTGADADAHRRAHLGAVDVALHGAQTALRALAARIDDAPLEDHRGAVLRVRLLVEAACDTVIGHVGRALGATPYCMDADFARRVADLPVFLRQSHAERDLATLGAWRREEAPAWAL